MNILCTLEKNVYFTVVGVVVSINVNWIKVLDGIIWRNVTRKYIYLFYCYMCMMYLPFYYFDIFLCIWSNTSSLEVYFDVNMVTTTLTLTVCMIYLLPSSILANHLLLLFPVHLLYAVCLGVIFYFIQSDNLYFNHEC